MAAYTDKPVSRNSNGPKLQSTLNMVHVDLSPLIYEKARIISGKLEDDEQMEMTEAMNQYSFSIIKTALMGIMRKYKGIVMIHQDGFRSDIWRKKIHPIYKGHREFQPKSDKPADIYYDIARKGMFHVIPDVLEDCKMAGMVPVKIHSLEADDTIYLAIKKWHKEYPNQFIVTIDGDLLQNKLYFPKTRVFKFNGQEHSYDMIKEKINKKIVGGDGKDRVGNIASIDTLSKPFSSWISELLLKRGINKSTDEIHDWFYSLSNDKQFKFQNTYFERSNKNPMRAVNKKSTKKEIYSKSLESIEKLVKTEYEPWMHKNFERNKNLILFTHIPKELQAKINDVKLEIDETEISIFAGHMD